MNADTPHLKAHRENTHKTQTDIARIVSDITGRRVSQSQVSRWEEDPESIPGRMLRALAQALGLATIDELFAAPATPNDMMVQPGSPYRQLGKNVGILRACLDAAPTAAELSGVPKPTQVDELCRRIARKPNVVFTGHFDAGKSRLCNALLGENALPAKYRPTTAANTWLIHLDDRPPDLDEQVYVFASGFDAGRLHSNAYVQENLVAKGGLDTLVTYGTHQSDRSGGYVAVVYLSAPVLRACNLIDLPGNQHNEDDAHLADAALSAADAIVYVSSSTGFLDAEDMVHIRNHLRRLPRVAAAAGEPLHNFFVVASHAHPNINDDDLAEILDDGARTLLRELKDTVFRERFDVRPTIEEVRSRLFPFWFERADRRIELRDAIQRCVSEVLPSIWLQAADSEVEEFRRQSKGLCDAQILQYRRALEDLAAANRDLESRLQDEPTRQRERAQSRAAVKKAIEEARDTARRKLANAYDQIVNEDSITRLIEKRYSDKKTAQKHAAGGIIDLVQSKMVQDNQKLAESLTQEIDAFLGSYSTRSTLERPNGSPTVELEFDAKGAFLGGMAGLGTAGALAAWASSLGNLGGYIIVAKVASFLSSIGLGVGSATLVSFVAALGGPAVFGGAIAVAVGWVISALFGEAWQRRLARKVLKALKKQNMPKRFDQALVQYWNETELAFDAASTSLEEAYQKQLAQLRQNLHQGVTNRDGLERMLEGISAIRDFFAGLPWKRTSA